MGAYNAPFQLLKIFTYPTSEFTVKTATVIQPSVVLPIVYNDRITYIWHVVNLMGLT